MGISDGRKQLFEDAQLGLISPTCAPGALDMSADTRLSPSRLSQFWTVLVHRMSSSSQWSSSDVRLLFPEILCSEQTRTACSVLHRPARGGKDTLSSVSHVRRPCACQICHSYASSSWLAPGASKSQLEQVICRQLYVLQRAVGRLNSLLTVAIDRSACQHDKGAVHTHAITCTVACKPSL